MTIVHGTGFRALQYTPKCHPKRRPCNNSSMMLWRNSDRPAAKFLAQVFTVHAIAWPSLQLTVRERCLGLQLFEMSGLLLFLSRHPPEQPRCEAPRPPFRPGL